MLSERFRRVCTQFTAKIKRLDSERQDSLTSLARETGGRAALNGNDFSRDLEGIAVYLMSDASKYHTGDVVVIDGGTLVNL